MDGVVSSKLMEKCIAIRCYKAGKQRQTESNHERIKGGIKTKVIKSEHHSVYRLFRTCVRTSPRDISLIRPKKPNMNQRKRAYSKSK